MSGTVKFYALCCRNTEALKRHIETIPKEDLIVIINTLDSDFETIYYHFSEAKIVTIPNAGHWLHAENPKVFYSEVENFL